MLEAQLETQLEAQPETQLQAQFEAQFMVYEYCRDGGLVGSRLVHDENTAEMVDWLR